MKYLVGTIALCISTAAYAEEVNVENFVRAETDTMFRATLATQGGDVGEVFHLREPTTPDNQPVIRMNQDTLYTAMVLDLSEPVRITLPEIEGRYQSMQVINQDHYMFVEATPGTYDLTEENVGSQFAQVSIRTFANPTDPNDVSQAHAAQDAIVVEGGGAGPFEAPVWDQEALAVGRRALSDFAAGLGFEASRAFGREDEVDPTSYIIGAAAGWGGLPASAAMYTMDSVSENDGNTPYRVTVGDVPVDGFWSVTIYNAEGYLEANDLGVNNYNSVTAEQNDDGSTTIHMGGCEVGQINCIPITPGWNYSIRMYEPRAEILDGSWTFPEMEVAD
ncbi:DUF1214 domain-containing protein [Ruegeria atlantica]|uniref:DUF1214 domain-containing protein n=1 Tax=Ruegeria atlantica TaxID=81569 RepID=A0A0P1EC35_9RHOB|nr:DUF1214 domain-containing protein [Ruegeria atlantica]CUH46590.1 hypothetical protein RUA4292_00756 [Ruegeria atlantica]